MGTRKDLAEALDFYTRGLIEPTVSECSLDDVNAVFDELRHGKVEGRMAICY